MTRRPKKLFQQPSSKSLAKSPPKSQAKPPKKKPAPERRDHEDDDDSSAGLRLQKVMAAAGIGSRRHCEEMILAGRVEVDGKTVKKLGTKVEPTEQQIRVDGDLLKTTRAPVYYLINKPDGVLSTNYDPAGRTRVVDLVPQHEHEHLFTVGRLDMSSEGLILVTNDGELANRLTHPRYGVEKTYLALVAGQVPQEEIDKLRDGVRLAEGVARCVSVHVRKALPQSTLLEIVLAEGKNREIRRILAKIGHKVLTLKRIAIGDLKLRELKVGEFRRLSREEVKSLRNTKPTRVKRHVRRRPAGVTTGEESPGDVTPIVDTREREFSLRTGTAPRTETGKKSEKPRKPKGFERRNSRREPGTGTIIGE